jgi:N-acetylglucosamine-6-phosphate deacetylase
VISFVARRYDTAQTVRVRMERGTIHSINSATDSADAELDLPWAAPGLIDLQVNGFGGIAFNAPMLSPEQIEQVSLAMDAQGVTGYCPTVTTDGWQTLAHAVATIGRAIRTIPAVAERVLGIHLEGPYICPDDGPRGAHPRQHVRAPDWDEFQRLQELAAGHIRIVTLSPEYDAAPAFIRQAVAQGVLVAIGHTNADSAQIRAAVDAGARLSTHLGNGAHGQIRRHPNYIWDQLAEDRLVASLIVDGHHLPPSVVKSFLRAKTPQRCILVSDITSMAGLPPGQYEDTSLGAVEVLDDGRLVIAGQRQLLAGAALPITAGLANVLRYTEHGLQVAVDMASQGPAALIGHPPSRLEAGSRADLTLFRLPIPADRSEIGSVQVVATIRGGRVAWGELPGGSTDNPRG